MPGCADFKDDEMAFSFCSNINLDVPAYFHYKFIYFLHFRASFISGKQQSFVSLWRFYGFHAKCMRLHKLHELEFLIDN